MIRALRDLRRRLLWRFGELSPPTDPHSYSQCGEDRIVAWIFGQLGVSRPTYVDVGANDPIKLSNTYLFYRHRCRGVCVEANPALFEEFRRVRSRDTCVNVGIGARSGGTMPLHVFEDRASGLTTFSSEQAKFQTASGKYKILRTIDIPIISLNDFVSEHFAAPVNFMSIDIEGLEVEVLEPFDFEAYGPDVICAETLRRTESGRMEKNIELRELILGRGYLPFADTFINTIFVKADRFPKM